MLDFIKERQDRLHAITANTPNVVKRWPLLVEVALSVPQWDALTHFVNIYLYESLLRAGRWCYLRPNMLAGYSEQIAELPNITPNGLLLPKRHNLLSYNMVYRQVTEITKSLNIDDHATRIHSPINIRIVNGQPNPEIDARPRSSTKLHSDIWAGEFPNHVMIFIPVFGSMHDVGVDLYEPGQSFFPDFVRPLPEFNLGKDLVKDATKYDVVMKPSRLYLLDSYLLHQTIKKAPGLRLAINFAFLVNMIQSDLEIDTGRHDEYISKEEWYKYGSTNLLANNAAIRTFTAAEMNVVQNKYADDYRTVQFLD